MRLGRVSSKIKSPAGLAAAAGWQLGLVARMSRAGQAVGSRVNKTVEESLNFRVHKFLLLKKFFQLRLCEGENLVSRKAN